ncbi:MAG: ornithine carbamoyltransferase [Trueperaceae bacterium]|nr:ornithine carbamoyltransferase [Trueperaceae bacterium]
MRHLLRLGDLLFRDLHELFALAEAYRDGEGPRYDGCAALFFPPTSLRTRMAFELGATRMGLQPVTFPPETLDKPEAPADVAGYLAQWADILVARHEDIGVLEGLAAAEALPVVNAMTNVNHPCEVLSDLFALSTTADPGGLRYLFVGADGNIARAWSEAAAAFGLDLVQCCPRELAVPGARWEGDLADAVSRADVIVTDAPGPHTEALAPYRVTAAVLSLAPAGARFAPCPPFVRGREVAADATAHPAFVGYEFKAALLPMQQAVMALLLGSV